MPRYITVRTIKACYPKKREWSHKGDFGRLLIVGGSLKYSGAPALSALSALAALRGGCDLVTVAAPERAANIIASFSPDLIAEPLKGTCFNSGHVRHVLGMADQSDAVVIGGGLGRKKETVSFVRNLLSRLGRPCVIDADAIFAVSGNPATIKESFILTPHAKEFSLLSGSEPGTNLRKREQETRKLAKALNATILLKGHVDVISDGKETLLNRTGNPWMTKGGTGDILSGTCGAFLSMSNPPFNAACAAAHLTGLAGDRAKKEIGPGLIASDLVATIPEVLKTILK
jgi:hydroxyethylthiazole kinase-like uncharacterized protein yjeF